MVAYNTHQKEDSLDVGSSSMRQGPSCSYIHAQLTHSTTGNTHVELPVSYLLAIRVQSKKTNPKQQSKTQTKSHRIHKQASKQTTHPTTQPQTSWG